MTTTTTTKVKGTTTEKGFVIFFKGTYVYLDKNKSFSHLGYAPQSFIKFVTMEVPLSLTSEVQQELDHLYGYKKPPTRICDDTNSGDYWYETQLPDGTWMHIDNTVYSRSA